MDKSIGELLDSPGAYFGWCSEEATRFGVVLAATRLGLAKHVGSQPVTPAEVAERCGVAVEPVRRLIEFLTAEGVFGTDGEGRYVATPRSEFLRSAEYITMCGAWTHAMALQLDAAIRQGKTAYEVEFGMPVFEHFKANPDRAMLFGQAMTMSTAITEEFIFAHHRFAPFQLAVDVGGSQGSLLLRLLKSHPAARGILFDLPETAAQARDPVAAAPEGARVQIAAGSFFEEVPPGGDLYLLKQILHDWNDEECLTILRNVRRAIAKGGRVAVIERIIPEEFKPHIGYSFDMVMMVWTTGRERRVSEYRKLFAAAGFAFEHCSENPAGMGVMEAVPV